MITNWPNRICLDEPLYSSWNQQVLFENKFTSCLKWCADNLSSRGVLWEYEVEKLPGVNRWLICFAQPQDAVLFRLVNGV